MSRAKKAAAPPPLVVGKVTAEKFLAAIEPHYRDVEPIIAELYPTRIEAADAFNGIARKVRAKKRQLAQAFGSPMAGSAARLRVWVEDLCDWKVGDQVDSRLSADNPWRDEVLDYRAKRIKLAGIEERYAAAYARPKELVEKVLLSDKPNFTIQARHGSTRHTNATAAVKFVTRMISNPTAAAAMATHTITFKVNPQQFRADNATLRRAVDGRGRTYCVESAIECFKGMSLRTTAHEVTHSVHNSSADITDAVHAFWERRTRIDRDRNPNGVWMGDATGNPDYKRDEVTYPDRFRNGYTGKAYSFRNKQGAEVLSVGMEYLLDDPVRFAREDPDHFNFVMAMFKGWDYEALPDWEATPWDGTARNGE